MLRANLNDIQVFMAVVDAGSFVAGGQAMGLSRSAAGKAIIRLEDRLGARLLNRTTRTLSLTDRLADIVEEGFDLAVRIGVTAPDTRLVSRVVARYKAVLCASPSYLAERGEPLDMDVLAAHDCLIFSSRNQRQSWRFRGEGSSWVKAHGRSRLRLDSGEAIRDAAIAGLGIGFLPDFLVAEDLAAGRLRQVLSGLEADDVKIVTIYPDKRLLEPRVRHFIDLMVDEIGT
jgi:DNA-binding transcriptional LysR family regulator